MRVREGQFFFVKKMVSKQIFEVNFFFLVPTDPFFAAKEAQQQRFLYFPEFLVNPFIFHDCTMKVVLTN